MAELPSGTVTFLFTDVEGSTLLWETSPEAMQIAQALHDRLLRDAIHSNDGVVIAEMGDGMAAAFPSARGAVRAALDMQLALVSGSWPLETGALKVRMGLHTEEAELRDGRYLNAPLNRCARLMAAASGGQVVISGETAALVRNALPNATELIDLGEHRLRDVARPLHVHQLAHPALPRDFPPLKSLNPTGNLPVAISSFVGRVDDVRAVTAELERARLVTLTGTGGAGKTRLALRVAGAVTGRVRDGCWFCDLALANDAESVAQVVAGALGVTPRRGLTGEESIVAYAQSKQMLVVLDNCEHVLDAAAQLANALLRAGRETRVLATSRQDLGVEGEHVVRLGPLSLPPGGASFAQIAASDAVQLFVDRASAVRPDFELDASNGTDVAEICSHLDGIPLAIELAAVRVEAMSVREIAAHLDERFHLLTRGARSAPQRHQTLRAAVDWSYSLLTDAERAQFCQLGVFVGSFDLDAVAEVTSTPVTRWELLDTMTSLITKSMVVRDNTVHGTARYRLLETLREFASERLDQDGLRETVLRRHAEHYASFAEAAGAALIGPDEFTWRPRLRADLDNIRAAVRWSLDAPDAECGELAVRIAAALAPYALFEAAGDIAAIMRQVVPRASSSPPARRAAVLGAAAFDAFQNGGDVERAIELAADALRDGVDPECPAPGVAYQTLVTCLALVGRDDEARRLCDEGKEVLARIHAGAFHRVLLFNTAAVSSAMRGDSAAAKANSREALALARQGANPSELAAALWAASLTAVHDAPSDALAFADESIALSRAGASGAALGHVLAIRAQLEARAGHGASAVADLQEAIIYSHDKGDQVMVMAAIDRGVSVLASLGEFDAAAAFVGIATTGATAILSITPRPERADREDLIAAIRSTLGTADYDAAAERGARMSIDDAVTYALTTLAEIADREL